MSDRNYKLEIVTPERKIYSGEVPFAVFPGSEGELGIMADHAPLLARLDPGEIRITGTDGIERMAIAGGFLEVRNNDVSVLAETAEFAREIDKDGAVQTVAVAEEALKNAGSDAEKAAASLQLRKANARLKVAESEW